MKIAILTTGGTIDKVYFDAKSEFEVGPSVIQQVLEEALVDIEYEVIPIMQKDSLEVTSDDRSLIRETILSLDAYKVLITHGTDTMTDTATELLDIKDKTIVLTGALSPARFRHTDAIFNIGMAIATLQTKESGVYITMSGQVFSADEVRKDRDNNRFVTTV